MFVVGNMTDETWSRVLQVNLTSPMESFREAVNFMTKQENGGIVRLRFIKKAAEHRKYKNQQKRYEKEGITFVIPSCKKFYFT